MDEYELDKVCEQHPDCGCNCYNCKFFAMYWRNEYGYEVPHERQAEED